MASSDASWFDERKEPDAAPSERLMNAAQYIANLNDAMNCGCEFFVARGAVFPPPDANEKSP